jgi:hypothetical protein
MAQKARAERSTITAPLFASKPKPSPTPPTKRSSHLLPYAQAKPTSRPPFTNWVSPNNGSTKKINFLTKTERPASFIEDGPFVFLSNPKETDPPASKKVAAEPRVDEEIERLHHFAPEVLPRYKPSCGIL